MSKIDDFEKKFEKQEVVQKNSNTKYTVIGIAVVTVIFLILFGIALVIHSSLENSTKTSSKNSKDEKDFVDVLQIIPDKSTLEEIQELLDDEGESYSDDSYYFEIYYADSYHCTLHVNMKSDSNAVDYFSISIYYADKYDYNDALEKLLDEYTKKFGTPTPQYDDKTKKLTEYLWNDYSPSLNNTGFQYVSMSIDDDNHSIWIFYS